MKSQKIDVKYVAHLARLELTDEEVEIFQPQFNHVLEYIEQLNQLDVEGIEPMAHAVEVTNVFREDVVRPGLDRDIVLANAPAEINKMIKVPKILD